MKLDRTLRIVLAVLAPLGAACDSTPAVTAPTTVTGPIVENFSSQVGVRGVASRTFVAATSGTIEIALKRMGPPDDVVVGLGMGIPRADGRSCSLYRSLNTAAGASPQISVTAEAGTYCVQVFDVGHLHAEGSFSVDVTHP